MTTDGRTREVRRSIEWSVVVPGESKTTESPFFSVCGFHWFMRLVTECKESANDVTWTMFLVKKYRDKESPKFLLSAHVKNKYTLDVYMTRKQITEFETEIWSYNKCYFLNLYSEADLLRKLTFVFTFNYGGQQLETENKCVQTSPYVDDRCCLGTLSLDLRKLMEDGSSPDVELKCGDCTMTAHKLILGARSEVFRTMLQSDMLEGREGSVEIVDMDSKVFEIFIRYIYTGSLPELTLDTALALYEAGDKYSLEALRSRCGEFLAENLTPENACGILAMVDAHSDSDLKDYIVSYVITNKIPDNAIVWRKFCDDHPTLAIEVLNHVWQSMSFVTK